MHHWQWGPAVLWSFADRMFTPYQPPRHHVPLPPSPCAEFRRHTRHPDESSNSFYPCSKTLVLYASRRRTVDFLSLTTLYTGI